MEKYSQEENYYREVFGESEEEESQKEESSKEKEQEKAASSEAEIAETPEQALISATIKELDEKRWRLDELYEKTTDPNQKKNIEKEYHKLSEEVLELQRQYNSFTEQAKQAKEESSQENQEEAESGSKEKRSEDQEKSGPSQDKEQSEEESKEQRQQAKDGEEDRPTKEKINNQEAKEKTKKETSAEKENAKTIHRVFRSEYTLVNDLPENTILQRNFKSRKYVEFLDDVKSYYGVNGIMPLIDNALDKVKDLNPFYAENSASSVALEMASQFYLDKKSSQQKIENINKFVKEWLQDKSIFYQGAEKLKKAIAPEGSTEGVKWLAEETSTLAKVILKKDKTLSQIAQLLASQNVPYEVARPLVSQIENQNIFKATAGEYLKISKLPFDEKMSYFAKLKQELSVEGMPDMEKIKRLEPELAKQLPSGASETIEKLHQQIKENPQLAEQIQAKTQEILRNKENLPKGVKEAADLVEKKTLKTGRSKFWGEFWGGLGYLILMLICLATGATGKTLEVVTGVDIGVATGGKKH